MGVYVMGVFVLGVFVMGVFVMGIFVMASNRPKHTPQMSQFSEKYHKII